MKGATTRFSGPTRMLATLLTVLFAMLAAAPDRAAASPVERGQLGEKIDAYLGRAQQDRGFSGSVLVARDGDIVLDKGYGYADDTEGVPVGADTVFGVASLAKQFTAAAVLKLEEQGRLSVRAPISDYLHGVPEDKRGITVHQLLVHTSGLNKNHAGGDFEKMGREEALGKIFAAPLARRPGGGYEYSDSGYTVAAAVVEEVSGQSFESYSQENLFEPAGMSRTGFWDDPRFDRTPVAVGYFNGQDQGSPAGFPGPSWAIMGAGGILSTTGDLNAWWQSLQGDTILSGAGTDKLFGRYAKLAEEEYYGYGWEIRETDAMGTVITHNGAGNTGNAYLAVYPDRGLLIAVLSNRVTFRSITLGGLLEDDDLPYQVTLPADEIGTGLAENVAGGDFSELPGATLPLWLTVGALGALVVVLLGAAMLAPKLVSRLAGRKKSAG